MRIFGAIICESKDVALGSGKVRQFTLFEHKNLFSIWSYKWDEVGDQMRYHTHAFASWCITLWGSYTEDVWLGARKTSKTVKGLWPRFLPRNYCHRIIGSKGARTLVFAGRWHRLWQEYFEDTDTWVTYTWGRERVYNTCQECGGYKRYCPNELCTECDVQLETE